MLLILSESGCGSARRKKLVCFGCPEALLGGLADYNDDRSRCAIGSDDLAAVLTPLTSETVTTIVGLSELAVDGKLYNATAVFQ